MLYTLAKSIAQNFKNQEGKEVKIFAQSLVSLNGRRTHSLFLDKVDLAGSSYSYSSHNSWITDFPKDYKVGENYKTFHSF